VYGYFVGPLVALWRLGAMRGEIRGRGEVTTLAVACTDQIDAQIEIQREIDGERARWRHCADAAGMQTDDDG